MKVVRTIAQAREEIAAARARGATIGFVPTMGYLHEGHLSLVDLARHEGAKYVVVSIFVNPMQFAPGEDFEKYPRDEARDRELLEQRRTSLVFVPSVPELLPAGGATRVVVSGVSAPLEGKRRPGHFEGVATIVAKLLNALNPDIAVFGQKDAQQCAVVRRMVRDLAIPVRLLFGDTVRESDGLAMSSRNAYLSPEERVLAPALIRSLQAGKEALEMGAGAAAAQEAMHTCLKGFEGVELDYLRVVDPLTFRPPADMDRDLLVVGAVRIGRTRLIDNLQVPLSIINAGPSEETLTRSNRG